MCRGKVVYGVLGPNHDPEVSKQFYTQLSADHPWVIERLEACGTGGLLREQLLADVIKFKE